MFQTPKLGTLWLLFTSEHTVSGCLVNKPKRMSSKPDLKKEKERKEGKKRKGKQKWRKGKKRKEEEEWVESQNLPLKSSFIFFASLIIKIFQDNSFLLTKTWACKSLPYLSQWLPNYDIFRNQFPKLYSGSVCFLTLLRWAAEKCLRSLLFLNRNSQ